MPKTLVELRIPPEHVGHSLAPFTYPPTVRVRGYAAAVAERDYSMAREAWCLTCHMYVRMRTITEDPYSMVRYRVDGLPITILPDGELVVGT